MIVELTLCALIVATICYPIAFRFAQKHKILDTPDRRKLQDRPVPVFGGIVAVLGIIIPLIIATQYYAFYDMWYVIAAILILWIVGVTDDIRELSAVLRFIIEIGIVWLLIWHPFQSENGPIIENLYGIWGRHEISHFTAIPLTLIAGVGIINAINLIDGVDGYSSGYGIVANLLFAIVFLSTNSIVLGIFSLVAVAALIPFYLHNVFGYNSKMFLGDGGSLVIGMVMTYDVFSMLSIQSPCQELEGKGISLVALALAILCVPVFDTLRVMTARIIKGGSPFAADKTHLHHLYIAAGFSHVGTSTSIILLNLLVVGVWWVGWQLGLSITGQFYLVVAMGIGICVHYMLMRQAEAKNNVIWQTFAKIGRWTHFEQKGGWQKLAQLLDKGY